MYAGSSTERASRKEQSQAWLKTADAPALSACYALLHNWIPLFWGGEAEVARLRSRCYISF